MNFLADFGSLFRWSFFRPVNNGHAISKSAIATAFMVTCGIAVNFVSAVKMMRISIFSGLSRLRPCFERLPLLQQVRARKIQASRHGLSGVLRKLHVLTVLLDLRP